VSPTHTFRIRPAQPDDFKAVFDLRIHAEEWLAAAGIEQWTVRSTGESNIRTHIARRRTFIVDDLDARVIATLTLDGGDPQFWTSAELEQPAAYLYKFMVHSDMRGLGLGDVLLNWACDRARQHGAPVLRLDCWKTNTGLHGYYLKRGFRHLDTRHAEGRKSGALFERPTDLLLPESHDLRLLDLTTHPIHTRGNTRMDNQDQDHTPDNTTHDQYDPKGEAAIWQEAAALIHELAQETIPGDDHHYWNSALNQAERVLDLRAREIRQANGMYYRPLTGIRMED